MAAQRKARIGNRRSINAGGPIDVETARLKKRAKEKKEADEAIRKAEKAVNNSIRKSKNALIRRRINARKAERERKWTLLELQLKNGYIPIELTIPIYNPEKDLTLADLESLLPHSSLVQALLDLKPSPIDPMLLGSDNEVAFQLEKLEELVEKVDDCSDGPGGDRSGDDDSKEYDSDNDSDQSSASYDSIAQNADFISFI